MAKAQKTTGGSSSKRGRTAEAVEDAVVIEETPAEPAKPETAPAEPAPAEAGEPAREAAAEPAQASAEATAKHERQTGEPSPPPPPPVKARRGGLGVFLGLVVGGALAAAIGFGAARYVVPEGWPFPGTEPEVDPLVAIVEGQGGEISALGDRLAALEASTAVADAVAALQADIGRLAERMNAGLADIEVTAARVEAMEARLDAVEKLAPEGSEAAQAAAEAYARELAALREMFAGELAALEAQQADAAVLEAEAQEAARAAAGRAALTKVATALDTGQPFADALDELVQATGMAVPPELARLSATGAPTLAALQDAFPASARAAIEADIAAAVEDGSMSRTTAFFRTQLGARSLEPREGDDADAILSRAEAALRAGDIAGAVAEVATLPEAAKPAMADWVDLARTRQAALDANAALAQELNAK